MISRYMVCLSFVRFLFQAHHRPSNSAVMLHFMIYFIHGKNWEGALHCSKISLLLCSCHKMTGVPFHSPGCSGKDLSRVGRGGGRWNKLAGDSMTACESRQNFTSKLYLKTLPQNFTSKWVARESILQFGDEHMEIFCYSNRKHFKFPALL